MSVNLWEQILHTVFQKKIVLKCYTVPDKIRSSSTDSVIVIKSFHFELKYFTKIVPQIILINKDTLNILKESNKNLEIKLRM